jgi:hypothetical protein
MPRIELGFYAPEAYVMPLYHIPTEPPTGDVMLIPHSDARSDLVDLARIELAPLQCECSVLPLNYRPLYVVHTLP